jgi:hypothetical protein
MSKQMVSGSIAAVWLACGLAVAAQGTEAKSASSAGAQEPAAATITVAGCVQSESAVLKRNAAAGDAGMSDEFVIVQAKLNPPPSTDQPKTDAAQPADAPVGTSGSPSNFGKVYRVTGDKEAELKAFAGQKVEITGAFKKAEDAAAELGAVGTSGRVVTGDLTTANTPEITISAVKPVPGSCSAAK